jgi:site-specific recombinase XerC
VRARVYGHRNRVVPVTAQAARQALAGWQQARAACSPDEPALFVTRSGRRVSLRTVDRVIRLAGQDAGLSLSPMALRHSCAIRLADADCPAGVIAQKLGHARTETLRPYAALVSPGRPADVVEV